MGQSKKQAQTKGARQARHAVAVTPSTHLQPVTPYGAFRGKHIAFFSNKRLWEWPGLCFHAGGTPQQENTPANNQRENPSSEGTFSPGLDTLESFRALVSNIGIDCHTQSLNCGTLLQLQQACIRLL